MKTFSAVCIFSAVLLAQLAAAKLPVTSEALGKMEGVVAFCSQLNPKSAAQYKEAAKAMAGDASEKELTDARASKEYKEANAAIRAELGKLSQGEAVSACASLTESSKK